MAHEIVAHKCVRFYRDRHGGVPFEDWLNHMKDPHTRHRINTHIDRIRLGNLGDWKAVGGGVLELRMDFGPGYRLYIGQEGKEVIVLLIGGDKQSQTKDIRKAQEYWEDYRSK